VPGGDLIPLAAVVNDHPPGGSSPSASCEEKWVVRRVVCGGWKEKRDRGPHLLGFREGEGDQASQDEENGVDDEDDPVVHLVVKEDGPDWGGDHACDCGKESSDAKGRTPQRRGEELWGEDVNDGPRLDNEEVDAHRERGGAREGGGEAERNGGACAADHGDAKGVLAADAVDEEVGHREPRELGEAHVEEAARGFKGRDVFCLEIFGQPDGNPIIPKGD